MPDEFADKVVIVTGGASGIGRATVELFHELGATVVAADIDADRGEQLAESLGERAHFRQVDVGDPDRVGELVRNTVETLGGLHIMVNNAAVSSRLRKFLDDDLGDFQRIMSINVLGVMAGTQHAARHMAEAGGGAIVNMTSIGGTEAGGGVMIYRASKAAVVQFTKSAAIELARHDIRVNAIAPGNIPTPLLASSGEGMSAEEIEYQENRVREIMRSNRPLPREGTPRDVAEAVTYLTGERGRYITGIVLPVDGGTTAGKPLPKRS
ncbi:SDR family NAD(P)-dependent oxidoreductase [Nocardia bovistercoris]|uniref:SDR family oxidoreductase n=1 Tax=Nocardia bovistercoris TaxID=2785916 RepID=A0A931N5B2_9NOCA|nr:SDR family oxidoreductase [Nocardia bovistercoris]MBH0779644.1 SDR family oxidoreductase [Nocardia bovistercoris]